MYFLKKIPHKLRSKYVINSHILHRIVLIPFQFSRVVVLAVHFCGFARPLVAVYYTDNRRSGEHEQSSLQSVKFH